MNGTKMGLAVVLKNGPAALNYSNHHDHKRAHSNGSKEGFDDGSGDSRNGVPSRLAQLFRPPDSDFHADRSRTDSSDGIYRENHWTDDHIARDIGYRDGISAGACRIAAPVAHTRRIHIRLGETGCRL